MKSNVSKLSDSGNSEHVEKIQTLVSAVQTWSSSRVNVIRSVECADEGLWKTVRDVERQ